MCLVSSQAPPGQVPGCRPAVASKTSLVHSMLSHNTGADAAAALATACRSLFVALHHYPVLTHNLLLLLLQAMTMTAAVAGTRHPITM